MEGRECSASGATPPSPSYFYDHVVGSGIEQCVDGDIDAGECRMPDLFKSGNDETPLTTRAFWATVSAKVCNPDGTGCSAEFGELGCFLVTWM